LIAIKCTPFYLVHDEDFLRGQMWTAEQGLWGILLPVEKKARFGGGRLAIPCGGQRGKRPALVNPSSPGKSGIHAALIFAAAGRWLMRVSA
jgi:hypothetical protein